MTRHVRHNTATTRVVSDMSACPTQHRNRSTSEHERRPSPRAPDLSVAPLPAEPSPNPGTRYTTLNRPIRGPSIHDLRIDSPHAPRHSLPAPACGGARVRTAAPATPGSGPSRTRKAHRPARQSRGASMRNAPQARAALGLARAGSGALGAAWRLGACSASRQPRAT